MKKSLIMIVSILTFLIFNNLVSANSALVEYETDENGVVTAITIGEDVTNLMHLLANDEWKTAETIYFNAINCTKAYYTDDFLNEYYAFDGYDNIKKVVFGEKVTHIPMNIFKNKSTIEEVVFSSSIEVIDFGAFYGTGIKKITIPSSVKEIGNRAFGNCSCLTDIVFGSNDCVTSEPFAFSGVKQVTFLENVSNIPDESLSNCTSLTTVNMSDNVTYIGAKAFYNCTSLIEIDIPTACISIGSDAFNKCSLKELILGDAIEIIGDRAFYGCKFTNLVIPDNVIEIGEQAFTSDYLTEITLPFIGRKESPSDYKQKKLAYIAGDITTTIVENIGPVVDYVLKSNIKKVVVTGETIPDYAFFESRYIQQVDATSAKSIGEKSFYGCSSLLGVTLSDKVTKISDLAFYCCTNISEINVGNLTNIGYWSFYGCDKLNNIRGNATYVGENGFYNCTQLNNIEFLTNAEYIGVNALYNTAWDNSQPNGLIYVGKVLYRYNGEMPENFLVEIKEETISITDKSFYNCENLSAVTFPDSLKEIGNRSFQGCDIKTLILPKELERIGTAAFMGCPLGCDLVIPENVKSIGYTAFDGQIYNLYYNATECETGELSGPYASRLFSDKIINVIIGETVKEIPTDAFGDRTDYFDNCSLIENVYYYGTESEWDNILINSGNECLNDIKIHYIFNSMQLPEYYGFCGNYVYWHLKDSILTVGGYGNTADYDYYTENYAPWYEHRNNILSIQFKGNIECLGNSLFYGLPSISKIQVPETVTTLKSNVFYECESLNDVILPQTLTAIGSGVLSKTMFEENDDNWYENGFYYDNYLLKTKMKVSDDFVFKPNTTLIASSAFMRRDYKNIIVPKTVKYVGGTTFWECTAESVIFKGSVEYANVKGMFYNCDSLSYVILPKGITEIASNTFESCDMLEFIEIPEGVTEIWSYGFEDCKSLKIVVIPTTITSINNGTFYGCDSLSDIYFKNSSINTPYMNDVNTCFFNAAMHFNTPYIEYSIDTVELKHSVDVDVYNLSEGEIIVVGYKGNRFIDIMHRAINETDKTIELNGDIDEFKILIWEDWLNLNPLCRGIVIYN